MLPQPELLASAFKLERYYHQHADAARNFFDFSVQCRRDSLNVITAARVEKETGEVA
jgi:hypothetical protein